ncbi:PREDICTED: DDB1- and CUL4-associated factor 8-like isoform X1 [Amphimedon queenslandica]|uniref:Uncharacterized protein n=1 Tax=Amphimedon queenslandica TaxID=400682 RepID=A0A1X7V138_AMPQE|nr:PREDICTED: DDB1- and CUL4-associated factor 8-like isoform X1 [Amphimedon queenslandica]|eukprot:XP_019851127.1 PREDICTED: DDB1- and CUL4-associated factor 8-like isoform X1 [Amphimedon queenslandica]
MASKLPFLLRERRISFDPGEVLAPLHSTIYSSNSVMSRLSPNILLNSHHGCVNCIHFSESGRILASGSDDLHIILWDWEKGTQLANFESKHMSNVFQAKFMPLTNESVLVSASRDGQVRRHVVSSSGELVATDKVAYHNDSAHKLAIEPDNPHVFLSCGEDGSVLEVDLREDVPQRNKILVCKNGKNHRLALYSIFIDPSNYNQFAISGRDQFARVYDRRVLANSRTEASTPRSCEPLQKFCPSHLESPESNFHKANITCLVYSHDGKELLCSYNDEDIYTFDTTVNSCNGEYLKKFVGHRNNATVKGVNYFGLKSEYVVSGSDCGHVFLWDKNSNDVVQFFEGDSEGVVNCLEPHPHLPVLAVSGLDHSIKVCTPYSTRPMDTEHLKEVISQNFKDRKESELAGGENYGFLLEFLMHQYSRSLRRGTGERDSSDSSSYSEDENEEGPEGIFVEEGEEGEEGRREVVERRLIWQFPVSRRRHDDDDDDDSDTSSDAEPINCAQS